MAFVPTSATLTKGGLVFTDLTNLIILYGACLGASSNTTPRRQNGTSGYTPSGSNKFRVKCIEVDVSVAGSMTLIYADNDVGITTATAFTNTVFLGGDSEAAFITLPAIPAANNTAQIFLDFQIPNTKFIALAGDGTVQAKFRVYGYEEA